MNYCKFIYEICVVACYTFNVKSSVEIPLWTASLRQQVLSMPAQSMFFFWYLNICVP
jgi:hypothetical protein